MHVLIIGMTASGKTTLAKALAHEYRQRKIATAVLDPLGDPEWQASFQTTDRHEFLERVKRSRGCALFIDESGEMVGRYDDEMFWLATRSRHYGHRAHFISQRAAQLSPTVRHQCTRLFLFRVGVKDAKTLAEEFSDDTILRAGTLPQYQFISVNRFGKAETLRLEILDQKVNNGTDHSPAPDSSGNSAAKGRGKETAADGGNSADQAPSKSNP